MAQTYWDRLIQAEKLNQPIASFQFRLLGGALINPGPEEIQQVTLKHPYGER